MHQPPVDVFSWQTFIALNWPADSTGKPLNTAISSSPNAPRVWEYYSDPAEVFASPVNGLRLRLGVAKKGGQKFLYLDSKSPAKLMTGEQVDASQLQGFQEADGHPLIDKNLNFVLYELKMNPVETKFVLKDSLTTLAGIYTLGSQTKNKNSIPLPMSDSASGNAGSMEIKASWRILVPSLGDDTSRYYCRKATIFIDSAHTSNKKNLTITNVTVGLVGMHIIRKTQKLSLADSWSTYEHIDNVPDNQQEAQQSGKVWSFYNPACLNCMPNKAPEAFKADSGRYIWNTQMPYAKLYAVKDSTQQTSQVFGTQVMRVYPVYRYTEMINRLWQDKLKGTVWANYRLIGTQWETSETPPETKAPHFLANATLETFIQKNSSCISCHNGAAIKYNGKIIKTDMSFIFPAYALGGSSATQHKSAIRKKN
jgi:hypothetical protein